MREPIRLNFQSTLHTSRAALWQWITDVRCLRKEMMPYLLMTVPAGVRSLNDLDMVPGRPLFRSLIFYGCVLPLDYSHLTLLELQPERGFVEQSPMLSMRAWRHERQILDVAGRPEQLVLEDRLVFEPRFAAGVSRFLVRRLFEHRHAVLRKAHLGTH